MELTDRQLPFELKIYMDEAGRWPLAGPVSVGTVIQTSADLDKSQFADSKKLSPLKREVIYEKMCIDSHRDVGLLHPHTDNFSRPQLWLPWPRPPLLIFSVGFASAHEIDEYGIIWSIQRASIRSLYETILHYYEYVLRDALEESVWGDDHIFQIVMDNQLIVGADIIRPQWQNDLSLQSGESTQSDACNASLQLQQSDACNPPLQDQIQFLRLFFHTPQRQFVYKWLYIDGNHTFGLDILLDLKVQTIIKGDARNPMIGAASIAAKVERDRYMKEIDEHYMGWWFAKHKWYGTKEHRERLISHSECSGAKWRIQEHWYDQWKLDPSLRSGWHVEGWQVTLTPEHRITFLSRILSGESHK